MNEWQLLEKIKTEYIRILGNRLTGIYVHGSMAFGCFRWECSDIDFLVIVESPLLQSEKEALIRTLLELDAAAPAKGFEMSVLLRSACWPFADPVPYELHYSNAHTKKYQHDLAGTCRMMNGTDPDLPAHMTVVQKAGVVLYALPVETVFAPVPPGSYLRSVWTDIEHAPQEIVRDPVYFILNLCRVLACAEEKLALSKEQGGEWGIRRLPGESELIRQALAAYRGGTFEAKEHNLSGFAQKLLKHIQESADFQMMESKNIDRQP